MVVATEDFWKIDFDPIALKKRYLEERDRRLKPSGQSQWVIIGEGKGEKFKGWLQDPWAEPLVRDPIEVETTVLILGGGFSGITTAAKLKDAGITDFKMIDKAGDFGGNWYWNRYPGAACDSEAYCYLPLLEETGYMPVEKYTRAPEILAHCRRMANRWNLYDNAIFQTEAREIVWSDEKKVWTCSTNRGDKITAQFVVTAGGPLHRPKLPDLPGIETFKGHEFHTSRWDYDYTGGDSYGSLDKLGDKKVAFIGTGATAIQCIPYLGASCGQLYVFQRTPSAVDVRNNKPTDPEWYKSLGPGWQKRRDLAFQAALIGQDIEGVEELDDGFTNSSRDIFSFLKRNLATGEGSQYSMEELLQLGDFKKMEFIRRRVDEVVKDKKTAEALKPWYNLFCKRPVYSDDYLETFNRPNVTLVDTNGQGVERITERGVVANGEEYEVDCIIWGTGFDIFGPGFENHTDFKVIGRDGLTKEEKFKQGKGYATLYGVCTHGLPNAFWYSNTQAAVSTNFPSVFSDQAQFVVYCIASALKQKAKVIEVTVDAEEEWAEEIVAKSAERKNFRQECTPGYYNDEGSVELIKPRNLNYGPGAIAYRTVLQDYQDRGTLEGFELTF
ncbi:putative monooxygenase [Hyaloraphidium curvatum]|nr:putative monooxygenase [Hyaloraphidium curvatum]